MKHRYLMRLVAPFVGALWATTGTALADAFEPSTPDAPKYYRIYTPNRENRTLTENGAGQNMTGATASTTFSPHQLWRVETRPDGTYNLVSLSGLYISPAHTTVVGSNPVFRPIETAPTRGWSLKSIGQNDLYTINSGSTQLHQGAHNDAYRILNWGGGANTSDAGCQFRFQAISDEELQKPAGIYQATAQQGFLTMAPGNKERILMRIDLQVGGYTGRVTLDGVTLDLGASTDAAADLANVQLFSSANNLFYGRPRAEATLLGQTKAESGRVKLRLEAPVELPFGTSHLFVTADVAPDATLDHVVDATLVSIDYNTDQALTLNTNPTGAARIFARHAMVYGPYDGESQFWRIPAMVVLRHQQGRHAVKNGRIVTMADMRFNHNADLPNHIDVYERHSDDEGNTWSELQLVAGNPQRDHTNAKGRYGYGDVALVETASGRLVAVMAAGNGYWQSNGTDDLIRTFVVTSDDGGDTWSAPRDITSTVYDSRWYNSDKLLGTFAGSGRGLLLEHQKDPQRNGRILFAMSHRLQRTGNSPQEYILYSDDEGKTWAIGPQCAYAGGDESKLVELSDGTVMISVRQTGNRGFNTSEDGGMTWGTSYRNAQLWQGNACNADVLAYDADIVLHSLNNASNRSNITLYASLDGARTFPFKKVICALPAAYSTIDRLPNGQVAVFFEDNSMGGGYSLNYVSLPIEWVVPADARRQAFRQTVAQARLMVDAGGYTDTDKAQAGQYRQAELDTLAALLPSDEEIEQMSAFADATARIEAAIDAARATQCTVSGHANTTTFAISSRKSIGSQGVRFITATGQTAAGTTATAARWQVVPAATDGRAYLKLEGENKYLARSGTKLVVQAGPAEWAVTQGDDCFYLQALNEKQSYLVINTGTGQTDYWNNTAGNATWSTQWVLTAAGSVETGLRLPHTATDKSEAVYSLTGVRMPAGKPLAPGIYVVRSGGKARTVVVP